MGPFLSGSVTIGILQLAQRAGNAEVNAFMAEIKRTTIQTANGPVPMAKWLNANQEWRLFMKFMKQ